MAGKQFNYAVRTAATLYTAHSYRYTVQFNTQFSSDTQFSSQLSPNYTVQFTVQFTATQGGSNDGSSQNLIVLNCDCMLYGYKMEAV